jgi:hypothetical protein
LLGRLPGTRWTPCAVNWNNTWQAKTFSSDFSQEVIVQNDNNAVWSLRRPVFVCVTVLFVIASLSACTTARKVGHGAKHAVKEGVEAVKEGGREVKRAIKEN